MAIIEVFNDFYMTLQRVNLTKVIQIGSSEFCRRILYEISITHQIIAQFIHYFILFLLNRSS